MFTGDNPAYSKWQSDVTCAWPCSNPAAMPILPCERPIAPARLNEHMCDCGP